MGLKYPASQEEYDLAGQIARRYIQLRGGSLVDSLNVSMYIGFCHANGCALDLEKLLRADDTNFLHDVDGIIQHLNTKTGKLGHYFLPRAKARTSYGQA